MYINGKWLTEPEILDYVNRIEAERAASSKLLTAAVKDMQRLGYGDCTSCRYAGQCSSFECKYEWQHQAAAEKLINKEA